MDNQPVTIRLDDDVCARLDEIAKAAGYNTKNLMIAQIGIILSKIPPKPEEFLARLAAFSTPTKEVRRAELVAL